MAITLGELELKFKSDAAAAGSKDVAAMQRVEQQVERARASVDRLRVAQERTAAARAAADEKLSRGRGVVDDIGDSLGAARRRLAELSNSGTPPAMLVRAKQDAADLAGKLDAARLKMHALQEASARAGGRDEAAKRAVTAQEQEIGKIDAARGSLAELARAKDRDAESTAEAVAQGTLFANAAGKIADVALKAAAAILQMVASVVAFGFQSASAARNLGILGLAITRTEAGGREFADVVNQLAGEVPLAKDQIAALAGELGRTRLAGRDLQASLAAVAIVTSALGDSAGGSVKSLIEASLAARRFSLGARDAFGDFAALAGTGLKGADVLAALAKNLNRSIPDVEQALRSGAISVSDGVRALEEAARTRFGKVIALQMLDAQVQFTKAREAAAALFEDVNIEGALKGLRDVLSVLDQSTVTGRQLKAIVGTMFQSIADAAEVAGPILKKVFQGFIIAALLAYIAAKPVIREIKKLGDAIDLDWLKVGLLVGAFAFGVLATAATIAGVAMFVAFLPILIPLGLIIATVYGLYVAFQHVKAAAGELYFFFLPLFQLDFSLIATSLIDGLVNGITSGAGRVLGAITSLGAQMKSAMMGSINAKSPSRDFIKIGGYAPAGVVLGVEEGTPDVEMAVRDMGESSVDAFASSAEQGGAAPGGGHGGRSVVINFNGPVNVGGREATADEREAWRGFFKDLMAEVDGAPV